MNQSVVIAACSTEPRGNGHSELDNSHDNFLFRKLKVVVAGARVALAGGKAIGSFVPGLCHMPDFQIWHLLIDTEVIAGQRFRPARAGERLRTQSTNSSSRSNVRTFRLDPFRLGLCVQNSDRRTPPHSRLLDSWRHSRTGPTFDWLCTNFSWRQGANGSDSMLVPRRVHEASCARGKGAARRNSIMDVVLPLDNQPQSRHDWSQQCSK